MSERTWVSYKKSQILNAYILLGINDEGLIDVSTEISDPLE